MSTDQEIAEICGSSLSDLTNRALSSLLDICADAPNLALAVSTLMTHRLEMHYRTNFINHVHNEQKKLEDEPMKDAGVS